MARYSSRPAAPVAPTVPSVNNSTDNTEREVGVTPETASTSTEKEMKMTATEITEETQADEEITGTENSDSALKNEDVILEDDLDEDEEEDDEDDEDEDDEDEDESDEAKAQRAAAKAERAAAKAAEIEKLVANFAEVVSVLVEEGADPATGRLSDESVDKIQVEYSKLPGRGAKSDARTWAERQMHAAILDDNLVLAKAYMDLGPKLKVIAARVAPVKKAVTLEEKIAKYAEVRAVVDLSRALLVVPKEVEEASDENGLVFNARAEQVYLDSYEDTSKYIEYLQGKGDKDDEGKFIEPNVSDLAKAAARGAIGYAPGSARRPDLLKVNAKRAKSQAIGGPRAPRRSPRNHIREAFADQPVGTFLRIKEIAAFKSEEYGDDTPSSGALVQNLNNEKFELQGIIPDEDESGTLGARKVSE